MSDMNPLEPNTVPFNTEPSLVFDALDLDLVLKVLSNTAFSELPSFSAIRNSFCGRKHERNRELILPLCIQVLSSHSSSPSYISLKGKGSMLVSFSGAVSGLYSSPPSVRHLPISSSRFCHEHTGVLRTWADLLVHNVGLAQLSSVVWRNGFKSERVLWEDQIVLITGGTIRPRF